MTDAHGLALTAVFFGCCLLVAGVCLLAGVAWALITASVPFLAFAGVLIRGLMRG